MKKSFLFACALLVMAPFALMAEGAPENAPITPSWTMTVTGVVEGPFTQDDVDESMFESMSFTLAGEERAYQGLPFTSVIDLYDGGNVLTIDEEAWTSGYSITLIGSDGRAGTFDTNTIHPQDLLVALSLNGQPIAPTLVGELPKDLWVKDIIRIELNLATSNSNQVQAQENPESLLTLQAGEKSFGFTTAELKESPWFAQGVGSFKTSAGSIYENAYSGVRIKSFLEDHLPMTADTPITFLATDGYEMTFSGSQFLDTTEGEWILANEMDGAPLDDGLGPFRMVKIDLSGESIPMVEGHLSVKMVNAIRVDAQPFEDFTLEITGKMDVSIDRQTLQSGVSAHGREVTLVRKGVSTDYVGIPLWYLLAYADDADYAPHRQDKSIMAYSVPAVQEGYTVVIRAIDGYEIELNSADLDRNADVIIATEHPDGPLDEREFPLVLAWDSESSRIPEGIKNVRQVAGIELRF
ncbi:MAG: molybdopterin-dependent oxidoreductase [Spirochaetales bacterium]|nr:molybdopterin-dependent oxidoreductase [Spirochaetales bacterium]